MIIFVHVAKNVGNEQARLESRLKGKTEIRLNGDLESARLRIGSIIRLQISAGLCGWWIKPKARSHGSQRPDQVTTEHSG